MKHDHVQVVRRCTSLVVAVALCAQASKAASLPATFTLGKLVPADAWLYVHGVRNPEADWIYSQWDGVIKALKESGVDKDLMSLFVAMAPVDKLDSTQTTLDRLGELVGAVRWSDLAGAEFSFALRFNNETPLPYDYFFLFRGAKGTGDRNAAALTAIMKEFASWSTRLEVTQRNVGSVSISYINVRVTSPGDSDIRLSLVHNGDVIGVLIGARAMKHVVTAMASEGKTDSFVESPRFTRALAEVAAPEDMVFFFDGRRFFSGIQRVMGNFGMGPQAAEPQHEKPGTLVMSLIGHFDVFDYVIETLATDGRRQAGHTLTRLKEDKLDSPFVKALIDRKPFTKLERCIPAEAKGFCAGGFVDLELLYDTALQFVKKEMPDGAAHIEHWNAKLAQFDFDPHRDVFSWWSGEYISMVLPPAVVTPMSSEDSVMLLRVKDGTLADEKIRAALERINEYMTAANQPPLVIVPAQTAHGEGFVEVIHPMMAMFLKPVFGVHKEWLVVANSVAAVNKYLAVAAGEAPCLAENERYKAEGIQCDRPVRAASFTDLSKLGQEWAQATAQMGMFGGLLTAQIPDEHSKMVVGKLLNMVMKLGPVLQKIDFYSSKAMTTTVQGTEWRDNMVITYKPPKPDEPKTAARTDGAP